jgi:hypothetical protein
MTDAMEFSKAGGSHDPDFNPNVDPDAPYTGDLIETLHEIVATVTGVRCAGCEAPGLSVQLCQCKGCHVQLCAACARDHSCGGGPEPQHIRY